MVCKYCGSEIKDNARFCPKCGKKLMGETNLTGPAGMAGQAGPSEPAKPAAFQGVNMPSGGVNKRRDSVPGKIIAVLIAVVILLAVACVIIIRSRTGSGKTEDYVKEEPKGQIFEETAPAESVNNDEPADISTEQAVSEQSEVIAEPAETNEADPVQESEAAAADEFSDCQICYIDVIENEHQKLLAGSSDDYEYNMETIEGYSLYDIDKDGMPELFIRLGHDEASYHGRVYTFKNGELKLVEDELPMGHTYLESDPNENGVLLCYGHMGYAGISKASLRGDRLEYENIFDEDINEGLDNGEDVSYTPTEEIVPGASYIDEFSSDSTLPIKKYFETLEFKTGDLPRQKKAIGFPDGNSDIYRDIIANNQIVNAVAADRWCNNPGRVHFGELLREDVIYPYTSGNLIIKAHVYSDIDFDGIYECILYFSELGNESSSSHYRGIISRQNGEFYIYLNAHSYETAYTDDGYLIDGFNGGGIKRIIFERENAFEFNVSGKVSQLRDMKKINFD